MMSLFAVNMSLAPLMFAAGCALLTWLLLKRSYRYFGRSSGKRFIKAIEEQYRPQTTWDGAQRDSLARIERQKVEMHEMTRDLKGELNSKIIVLEKLIADSQRQIERMEQLLHQAEQTDHSDNETASADPLSS